MIIEDAPEGIALTFAQWLLAGKPYALTHALEQMLWGYRGRALIVGARVVWLARVSDRHDEIRYMERACRLETGVLTGATTR